MKMEPLPRPAYLDAASPKQALISFHSEQAQHNRQQLTEQMLFEIEQHNRAGNRVDPARWWHDVVENAAWEDGSVIAIWRDRMRFHERCVEELVSVG